MIFGFLGGFIFGLFWLFLELEKVHNSGIAHRDLKGENILITKDLEVKFCDFGCAYEFDDFDFSGHKKGLKPPLLPEGGAKGKSLAKEGLEGAEMFEEAQISPQLDSTFSPKLELLKDFQDHLEEEPIGSIHFNAPEVDSGRLKHSFQKSDIFSLGCIIFQLVSF